MRKAAPLLCCALAATLLLAATQLATSSQPVLRGVAPSDRAYFSGKTVRCRDGLKSIAIERVNDDFCDCPDGTDEPGTSACPSGKFYCRNRGHVPQLLFSSRVNDGICDCCDGSDEYEGRVKCANTCKEEGASSREQLTQDVSRYSQGLQLRNKIIEQAQGQRQDWDAEVTKLRAEEVDLKLKEAKLLEEKTAIEKAEKEEREWKEKMEKEQAAQEQALNEATMEKEAPSEAEPDVGHEMGTKDEASPEAVKTDGPPAEEADLDHDEFPEPDHEMPPEAEHTEPEEADLDHDEFPEPDHEMPPEAEHTEPVQTDLEQPPEQNHASEGQESGESENLEGLSKEEIGRIIASRWTGGGVTPPPPPPEEPAPEPHHSEHPVDDDYSDHEHEDGDEHEDDRNLDDDIDGDHKTETPHDDGEYGDDEDDEHDVGESSETSSPAVSPMRSWLARVLQWPRDVCSKLLSMLSQPPPAVNKSEADRIKKEHREASQNLRTVQKRISELEKKLSNDYGPNGEFISLADQCLKITINQYEYKICPYNDASQAEGHINTRLGTWAGFSDNYAKLLFKNGDRCWNGPERSMTVTMQCGLQTEVLSVDEPSRCEYAAVMTTPAVCSASKAEELKRELAEKLQELAGGDVHDEL